MNKEEIEELKDFTIDLTNIDELALGLEVCSKKSNVVIQELADTIIQLQQENKQLKDNWNKLKEIINTSRVSKGIFFDDGDVLIEIKNMIGKIEKGDSDE